MYVEVLALFVFNFLSGGDTSHYNSNCALTYWGWNVGTNECDEEEEWVEWKNSVCHHGSIAKTRWSAHFCLDDVVDILFVLPDCQIYLAVAIGAVNEPKRSKAVVITVISQQSVLMLILSTFGNIFVAIFLSLLETSLHLKKFGGVGADAVVRNQAACCGGSRLSYRLRLDCRCPHGGSGEVGWALSMIELNLHCLKWIRPLVVVSLCDLALDQAAFLFWIKYSSVVCCHALITCLSQVSSATLAVVFVSSKSLKVC